MDKYEYDIFKEITWSRKKKTYRGWVRNLKLLFLILPLLLNINIIFGGHWNVQSGIHFEIWMSRMDTTHKQHSKHGHITDTTFL